MKKSTNVIKLSENQLYNVITEILTQVLQEGYVGSLRKKIYSQDPNEKSTLDIHSDEDDDNSLYHNYFLPETVSITIPEEYIVDEDVAQRCGFRKCSQNPFNDSIYEMWINPKVSRDIWLNVKPSIAFRRRPLRCKPYKYQKNADGTFKVAIIVLPEKQIRMTHSHEFFDKMRKNIVLPKNQVMMALPPVEFIDNKEDIK